MRWFEQPSLVWLEPPLPILSDWPKRLARGAGVYRLVAQGQTVRRACGDDNSGTLYIGKADALDARVCSLRATLRPDFVSATHGAGLLFNATRVLVDRYPLETLATTWAATSEPSKCWAGLIDAYLKEFGDAPPLNRHGLPHIYD